MFTIRLDCVHLGILYTNFKFGNLPTFLALHDLDSFLQVHVTHAEDVLLDVGVHQTSDELEPRDCLCERACHAATALHLKVASGGAPLESRQLVSHAFINLWKQPQELLNVDSWVLVPDGKGFHVLHQLCLGQGEVRAMRPQ